MDYTIIPREIWCEIFMYFNGLEREQFRIICKYFYPIKIVIKNRKQPEKFLEIGCYRWPRSIYKMIKYKQNHLLPKLMKMRPYSSYMVLVKAIEACNVEAVYLVHNWTKRLYKAFLYRTGEFKDRIREMLLAICELAYEKGNKELREYIKSNFLFDATRAMSGACKSGNLELVKEVINTYNIKDFNEFIGHAGFGGNQAIVDELFRRGATNIDALVSGAIYGGHLSLVKKYLRFTMFMDECYTDDIEICKYLLTEGFKVNLVVTKKFLRSQDDVIQRNISNRNISLYWILIFIKYALTDNKDGIENLLNNYIRSKDRGIILELVATQACFSNNLPLLLYSTSNEGFHSNALMSCLLYGSRETLEYIESIYGTLSQKYLILKQIFYS